MSENKIIPFKRDNNDTAKPLEAYVGLAGNVMLKAVSYNNGEIIWMFSEEKLKHPVEDGIDLSEYTFNSWIPDSDLRGLPLEEAFK